MFKMVLRVIKLFLLFISIVLITGTIYSYSLSTALSTKEYDNLVVDIQLAEPLPDKFYDIFEVVYSDVFETNTFCYVVKSTVFDEQIILPSELVCRYYIIDSKSGSNSRKAPSFSCSMRIESRVSQKQCVNWLMRENNFSQYTKGINEASEFFFKKDIIDLDDEEYAGLVLLFKNYVLYNPHRNPENYKTEVNKILEKYYIN